MNLKNSIDSSTQQKKMIFQLSTQVSTSLTGQFSLMELESREWSTSVMFSVVMCWDSFTVVMNVWRSHQRGHDKLVKSKKLLNFILTIHLHYNWCLQHCSLWRWLGDVASSIVVAIRASENQVVRRIHQLVSSNEIQTLDNRTLLGRQRKQRISFSKTTNTLCKAFH